MSRSKETNFRCSETCTAYHSRPYIETALGISRARVYQLLSAGRLTRNYHGGISCQSARKYRDELDGIPYIPGVIPAKTV